MTLATWIARPLRRFLGTAVMLAGGMSVIHHLHYPRPRFPHPGADRVTVWVDGTRREIRDPARVRRIAAFIRVRQARDWRPIPEFVAHFTDGRSVSFHRGARTVGSLIVTPELMSVPAGPRWTATLLLTPAETAELHRLLGTAPPVRSVTAP